MLESLLRRGFHPVALPLYPNAVGIRRGEFAALLEPVPGGPFRRIGQVFYVIDGNLSVRLSRGGREWFCWKSKQREVTHELLAELARFSDELLQLLDSPPQGGDFPA